MKRRALATVTLAALVASLSACTTVAQKNSAECARMMKGAWHASPVVVTDTQASADGRTVILSGTIEDPFWHNVVPAQVQCQFTGTPLPDFRWLAPARLAEESNKARANSLPSQ